MNLSRVWCSCRQAEGEKYRKSRNIAETLS